MDKIKRAGILFSENRLREAIDIYPNFPPAYHGVYEFNRKEYHEQGFDWVVEHFIDPALKSCLGSPDILCLAMDIAMRFGKFEEAIKYGEESLVKKPENPMVLERMMFIMREMAIVFGKQNNKQAEAHYYGEAVKIAKHTREICAELFGQMTSDIYKFESLLEIPEQ
jgi:tetratricopeptide (TPR) repeat protein